MTVYDQLIPVTSESTVTYSSELIVSMSEGCILSDDIFARDVLTVRSKDDHLIASICKSMPQSIRENLTDRFDACFEPGALQEMDTAEKGGENFFHVLHFTWYNRHCTTVSGPSRLSTEESLKTSFVF